MQTYFSAAPPQESLLKRSNNARSHGQSGHPTPVLMLKHSTSCSEVVNNNNFNGLSSHTHSEKPHVSLHRSLFRSTMGGAYVSTTNNRLHYVMRQNPSVYVSHCKSNKMQEGAYNSEREKIKCFDPQYAQRTYDSNGVSPGSRSDCNESGIVSDYQSSSHTSPNGYPSRRTYLSTPPESSHSSSDTDTAGSSGHIRVNRVGNQLLTNTVNVNSSGILNGSDRIDLCGKLNSGYQTTKYHLVHHSGSQQYNHSFLRNDSPNRHSDSQNSTTVNTPRGTSNGSNSNHSSSYSPSSPSRHGPVFQSPASCLAIMA
ncbi:unnamed protein product [Protopolystoma xenopodis]|uniref:Uncharacterized protein n=1 Tax=Protopolystoma xenopodis TaxID=117903 RepID=A0A3S5AU55_9PLAT|nr:unnamed protein product [Protopolystoma xenopodis]